ncbi:hypothetical protein M011DRAFT_465983 [Sporormia fimetaria CBS 119925]|uniref:F-box domain-containing protein n=1 Tax=Sporormia fimetaria CBS 119925 TaxID=1340428 RepID=A0A6A6VK20_9PLEO|nr:hypothetical protein M011DRAFT_465983 [Sporormia fimetaria CBS 119925]
MSPSLLTIPPELRQLIYEQLFNRITIQHGFGTTSPGDRTAILLTCKTLHSEASKMLPRHALFRFRGTEDMLNTLTCVAHSVLTQIRRMEVGAFPYPLYPGRLDFYHSYHFSNSLSLLPGLKLDCLKVIDCFHAYGMGEQWRDCATYFDFESLLLSDGWKVLEYRTTTAFMRSLHDQRKRRKVQPDNWRDLLSERDGGEQSNADVHMFIQPYNTQLYLPWSAAPGHMVAANPTTATPGQKLDGNVTIKAKRETSDYAVKGLPTGKCWSDLKAGDLEIYGWEPYYHNWADAVGWMYGGYARRSDMAFQALVNHQRLLPTSTS